MKTRKIYVLIPLYNDWLSLNKLLRVIDKVIKKNKKLYFKKYWKVRFVPLVSGIN